MIWDPIKNYGGDNPSKQSKFSASSRLDGKLAGSGTIIIKGKVKGEIEINGTLEISQNAEAIGNIKADKLFLHGKVEGSLDIAGSLSVEKTAQIQGDIRAGTLEVAAGAIINGQCSIGEARNGGTTTDSINLQSSLFLARIGTCPKVKLNL